MAFDKKYLVFELTRLMSKSNNLEVIRKEHYNAYNKSYELWRLREILRIEQEQLGLARAKKHIANQISPNKGNRYNKEIEIFKESIDIVSNKLKELS